MFKNISLFLLFFLNLRLGLKVCFGEEILKTSEDEFGEKLIHDFEIYSKSGYQSEEFKEAVEAIKLNSYMKTRQSFVSPRCLACRNGISYLIRRRRMGDRSENIARTASIVCKLLTSYSNEVCRGIVNLNIETAIFIIDSRPKLTGAKVCSLVLQGECGDIDKSLDFQLKISPPISSFQPESKSKSYSVERNSNELKILHFTDIHYDPNYRVGGNANCKAPLCCRIKQGNATREHEKAGKWGDYRKCDMPWHSIENAIKTAASENPDVDIIYYTGDSVDHGIWETSVDGNIAIMEKCLKLFKEAFGDKPIYSILGNHESQPLNVLSPSSISQNSISSQWLYDYFAQAWSSWLPEGSLSTVRKGGYYTTLILPGLRLIALNNNDCYIFNWWLLYSVDEVAEQLQWLHDTLLEAEVKNEKVHILAHIASGEGSCYKYWSREYRRVVERFHKTISAQFNGHSHFDEFNIFYESNNISNAINVAWNGGSLATFYDVNPNYIVYWVDNEIFQVNEYHSWIYSISEANTNPTLPPRWFRQYSFRESFNLLDLAPASLDNLLKSMTKDRKLSEKYFEYKVKGGDPFLKAGCKDKCLRGHLCEISMNEFGDYRKCKELLKNSFASNPT